MRATRWFWCIALVGCGLVSSASAEQAVRWQVSLEAAKRVASQTNRLVLIHFWADWCPPCLQELRATEPVYRRFATRGLEVLAVNIQQPREQVARVAGNLKISYPVLLGIVCTF